MSSLSKDQSIVLVADSFDYYGDSLEVTDRLLDRPHQKYVFELIEALKKYHPNVVWYSSPKELIENIAKHRDDIVFPYWFGQNSRNRHSIVPAICEGSEIKYLGGDAYTKIICNDKQLSKELCSIVGLCTPKSILLSSKDDLSICAELQYPCVVKPIFEGTSLGISQNNLVYNYPAAESMVIKLLKEFNQPVIVEEFISGREVSIALIGRKNKIRMWEAAERYVENDELYFFKNLYTFKEKKSSFMPLALRSVKELITEEVFTSCCKLFDLLDKVEYMRIDGKLTEDGFIVIELTPETHMGEDAEFCGTIATRGLSYSDILGELIENSLKRYRNQSSN